MIAHRLTETSVPRAIALFAQLCAGLCALSCAKLCAEDIDGARGVTAARFTAKKIEKLHEHASSIFDLALTTDGQRLLSVGTDGQVIMWNTKSWEAVAKADDPERKSLGVRVSPDGKYAVTASDPSEALIYQLPELKLLHRVKLEMGRTTNISCSSRLPMVAVAGSGPFSLAGLSNGKVMQDVPLFKTRSRVVWAPSGETLYIAGDIEEGGPHELHRWSLRGRKSERICELLGETYEMKWGKSDDELCLTGGEFAQVVNVNTGNVVDQWKSPDERVVADFLYWPRHDVYLTGTKGGHIYFWRHGVKEPIGEVVATTSQVHQVVPVGENLLAAALQQSRNSLSIFEVEWSQPSASQPKVMQPTTEAADGPGAPLVTANSQAVDSGGAEPMRNVDDAGSAAPELTPLHSFLIDTPFSRTLAFNANNMVLGVALSKGGMAFFDPRTGKETLPRLDSGDQGQFVSLVEPHADANLLLLQESNAFQSFYDLKQKKRLRPHGAGGLTGCVAWSLDRKFIFSGVQSGFDVGVFDFSRRHSIVTAEAVRSIYGALARGVATGPKNAVAIVRNDGVVQWFQHGRELSWEHDSLVTAHPGGGADLRYVSGQYLSIGKEGELKFWEAGKTTPVRIVSLGGKLKDARFLSDTLVAVARENESLLELHAVTASGVGTQLLGSIPFDAKSHASRGGIVERITSRVALAPNGKLLAALSLEGEQTRVAIYDATELIDSSSKGVVADVSPSAPMLTPVRKTQVATPYVRALAFNANNGALAVLGENDLVVLNSRTGKPISKISSPADAERRFVYPHPDPRLFFVADGLHHFKLIDARSGDVVREHNASHRFSCAASWSPDGRWLAYTHDQAGSLLSVDLKHNDGLNEMDFQISENDRIASGVAFSPRGDRIAMIRVDGRVLLLKNAGERKWEKLTPFQAHTERGTDIAFVGEQLMTIGAEGMVKMWTLGDAPTQTVSLGGELSDARFLSNNTVAVARDATGPLELHVLDASADQSTIVALAPFDGESTAGGVDGYFARVINRVAVSPDGRMLAAASSVDGSAEVTLYDMRELAKLLREPRADKGQPPRDGQPTAYRVWATADGKHRVEAQLVSLEGDVARLKRKSDGIVVEVPLSLLIEADRAYAKAAIRE